MSGELERDFTEFVESRTPTLFRTAMALTGDRQHAEDLLQTVLSRAFVKWRDIRDGHPEAYLRRAMYLQCVSRWRLRSYGREVTIDRLPDRGGGDESARVDLRLSLQAALRRLAPKQRAVVVLRYLEDLCCKAGLHRSAIGNLTRPGIDNRVRRLNGCDLGKASSDDYRQASRK